MGMLNNRNRKMPLLRSLIHLVVTIFTLTIIFASTTTLVSASTTGNTTTTTTSVGGEEQEAVSTPTTTTNNNVSNDVLGSLFLTEEAEFTSFNPINETYIEISYVGNTTIMPPNATNTINATETGNITLNIQPNGVNFVQGQGFIVTEDGAAAEKEENATFTYVMLSRANPDGTGAGTGVSFFNTN